MNVAEHVGLTDLHCTSKKSACALQKGCQVNMRYGSHHNRIRARQELTLSTQLLDLGLSNFDQLRDAFCRVEWLQWADSLSADTQSNFSKRKRAQRYSTLPVSAHCSVQVLAIVHQSAYLQASHESGLVLAKGPEHMMVVTIPCFFKILTTAAKLSKLQCSKRTISPAQAMYVCSCVS